MLLLVVVKDLVLQLMVQTYLYQVVLLLIKTELKFVLRITTTYERRETRTGNMTTRGAKRTTKITMTMTMAMVTAINLCAHIAN